MSHGEFKRDIFGSQNQGGGLGKIWNGRKLRRGFEENT
jgi:hypothetical protein